MSLTEPKSIVLIVLGMLGQLQPSSACGLIPFIRMGEAVQEAGILTPASPVYPALPQRAHARGRDGPEMAISRKPDVTNGLVASTRPMQIRTGINAGKQWHDHPILLQGGPIGMINKNPMGITLFVETPPSPPQGSRSFQLAGGMEPIHASAAVQPAKPVFWVPPEYPESAKDSGIYGTVRLEILISKTGRVERATVLDGPSELRQAAMDAVTLWRYKSILEKLEGSHISKLCQEARLHPVPSRVLLCVPPGRQ